VISTGTEADETARCQALQSVGLKCSLVTEYNVSIEEFVPTPDAIRKTAHPDAVASSGESKPS
jgi:hypothetical protein